ncbi:MAG TPA: FkbM family methyltransferase [Thermoanaerobaculia bacterium]|nr:FkbM family methyltransferase [Thermoanaerobaculia bacterium]
MSPFPIPPFYRTARRLAGQAKRRLRPSPEVSAWRKACEEAARVPRYTPGTIELMGYRLRYGDLLTLCPQWHDLFVAGAYRFQAAHPEPRILDCGANLGLASLCFKRLYPRARITAFEADPGLAAMARDNLKDNGAPDVEVVQAAVWTRDGTLDFHCEGADSGAIVALAGEGKTAPGPVRAVPCVRLRDLLEREPVDLLKLDVEGAEAGILADCAGALGQVRALIAEIHDFQPDRRHTPEILSRLSDAGFTYTLDELHPMSGPAGPAERQTAADSPFPGRPLGWVVLVRAWRTR